jgi:hypothetical protein
MQKNQARTVRQKERVQKAIMGLGIATFWDPSASKAVDTEAGGVTTDAIPSCKPTAKENESTSKIRIKKSRKIKRKPSSYAMGGKRRGGVRYGRGGLSAARHGRPTASGGSWESGRDGSAAAAGAATAAAATAGAAATAATCRDEKGARWVGGRGHDNIYSYLLGSI